MHIGQAHITAAEAVGGLLVVKPQHVKHGGMHIVQVALILNGPVAVFIGGAVDRSALGSPAAEKQGEPEGAVITAIAALGERSSPEFT